MNSKRFTTTTIRQRATQKRHQVTFTFPHYLGTRNLTPDSRVLTSQQMQRFAIWLQDTLSTRTRKQPFEPRRDVLLTFPICAHSAAGCSTRAT